MANSSPLRINLSVSLENVLALDTVKVRYYGALVGGEPTTAILDTVFTTEPVGPQAASPLRT